MATDTTTEEGSSTICETRAQLKAIVQNTKPSVSPFAENKIQLQKSRSVSIQNIQDNPEEETYAIVVNMECAKSRTQSVFLQSLLADQNIPSSMKSYVISHKLGDGVSESDLISNVNAESCIDGLTYNPKMTGGTWTENNKAKALDYKEYSLRSQFDGSNDPMDKYQFFHRRLQTSQAWEYFYHEAVGIKQNVVVAIVDSGLDFANLDFQGRLWTNANGFYGFDFVNNDDDPTADHYHGVFIAGIIGAAPDNGVGLRGILKEQVEFMTVKVLDNNNAGLAADFANGIRYAADNGAHVINSSLFVNQANGGILVRDAYAYAINNGAFIAQSAGNDSKNINNDPTSYPTIHTKDYGGVMSVASLHVHDETLSDFSNFGSTYVEIAGFGSGGIVSYDLNSGLRTGQGTSFAAPMVAAAAAQIIGIFRTHNINYNPALVEQLISNNGTVVNAGLVGAVQGAKVLNLKVLADQLQELYPQTKIPAPPAPPSNAPQSPGEDECV